MNSKSEYFKQIVSDNEESTGRKYTLSISDNNSFQLLIIEISGEKKSYFYSNLLELLESELLSNQSFERLNRGYFIFLDESYGSKDLF